MEVIGLAGFARSGKDTVADILEEITDGRVERDAFADRLKLIAALALGVAVHPDDVGTSGVRRWADQFKQAESVAVIGPGGSVISEISGRQFLQRLGAEGIRDVLGQNALVDAVPLRRSGVDLLVLTDVRFENEARAVRGAGGSVWRVNRPGVGEGTHRSEIPLADELVDVEIDNSGSITDLYATVKRARS